MAWQPLSKILYFLRSFAHDDKFILELEVIIYQEKNGIESILNFIAEHQQDLRIKKTEEALSHKIVIRQTQ